MAALLVTTSSLIGIGCFCLLSPNLIRSYSRNVPSHLMLVLQSHLLQFCWLQANFRSIWCIWGLWNCSSTTIMAVILHARWMIPNWIILGLSQTLQVLWNSSNTVASFWIGNWATLWLIVPIRNHTCSAYWGSWSQLVTTTVGWCANCAWLPISDWSSVQT